VKADLRANPAWATRRAADVGLVVMKRWNEAQARTTSSMAARNEGLRIMRVLTCVRGRGFIAL